MRRGGGKGTAQKQRAHDEFGYQQERHQAGDRQQQCELDRAVLGVAGALLVPGRDPARHFRQQHGAGGDANDANRKLVEAVGVVERRQRAGGEEAGDDGVREQRDLGFGRADGRGREAFEEELDLDIEPRPAKSRQRALPGRIGANQQRFEAPGDENSPGGGVACGRKKGGQGERRHHREIEQDRRGRSGGEARQRVEDTAVKRDQRHQQEIRKGDSGELDRGRKAAGVVGKPRCQ